MAIKMYCELLVPNLTYDRLWYTIYAEPFKLPYVTATELETFYNDCFMGHYKWPN